jgi:magnesium-protoporphyrin O-methyltransferase
MLDPGLGHFDHVIAMDSIIHYRPDDAARVLAGLAERVSRSVVCTFAPRTPMLAVMHAVGRLFPSSATRAPAIVPVSFGDLTRRFHATAGPGWQIGRSERVSSAFYKSQALEVLRQ